MSSAEAGQRYVDIDYVGMSRVASSYSCDNYSYY